MSRYGIYIPEINTFYNTVKEASNDTYISCKCINAISQYAGTIKGYTLIRVSPGIAYHHFKGNNYIIKCLANDSASENLLVVYENCKTKDVWARSIHNFFEVLDDKKYPDANQLRRFEPVTKTIVSTINIQPKEATS